MIRTARHVGACATPVRTHPHGFHTKRLDVDVPAFNVPDPDVPDAQARTGGAACVPAPGASDRATPMTREDKTWLVVLIVAAGIAAAAAYHYVLGAYLALPYPQSTFLHIPRHAGGDFVDIYDPVRAGDPYGVRPNVYPPFSFFPFWLVRFLPTPVAFAAMALLLLATTVRWLRGKLPPLGRFQKPLVLGVLGVFCYPVLFALDRGNLEALIFVYLAGFLTCYRRERWALASAFLAAAIAMKGSPGVFGVLLLARRQYRAAALTAVLTLGFTVGSAALYPGGVARTVALITQNATVFRAGMVESNSSLAFNLSYFAVLKIANVVLGIIPKAEVGRLILPYTVACLAAFVVLTVLLLTRGGALWQRVALLTLAMLLFPQMSGDYKLLHLLLPLGLFLETPPGRRDAFYAVLFGLLLIPKAYAWLRFDVSIAVLLNPLLMTALWCAIVAELWRTRGGVPAAAPAPTVPAPAARALAVPAPDRAGPVAV